MKELTRLMKNLTLGFISSLAIFMIASCNSTAEKAPLLSDQDDSCKTAKVFEPALSFKSNVKPHFSSELKNYWGNDTTKLDFKYVFKDGEIVKSYFYYENGRVQEEYEFKCGALHGMQKWYYKSGQLAKIIPFRYGYRQGIGELFDEEGKRKAIVTFSKDSMINVKILEAPTPVDSSFVILNAIDNSPITGGAANSILKIEMKLSAFGVESDNFPSIDANIELSKGASNCKKTFYNPAYKDSSYSLSKKELKQILAVLSKSDLGKLKKEYTSEMTDQPTSTTTIYTSSQKYIIKDYGLIGEYPLQELYKIVYKY